MVLRQQGSGILDEIARIPVERLVEKSINSPEWQLVLDRERVRALEILDQIEQKYLDFEMDPREYGLSLRTRLVNWMSVMYHHRNQVRKSGGYYSEHLWNSLSLAIKSGFIEDVLNDSIIGHDTIEDIPEVRTEIMDLFFNLYEDIKPDPLFNLEYTQYCNDQAWDDITAVSKPKIDNKSLRSQKYLEMLLKKLLENGKAILIKLFDRLHNMETIAAQPVEKQSNIAKETMEIFVPIAKRLGLYKIQEELVRLSLQVLNPNLIKDFNEYIAEEIDTIENAHPFFSELKEKLNYKAETKNQETPTGIEEIRTKMKELGIEGLVYSPTGIVDIRVEPHLLVSRFDILDLSKGVENLTLEDLRLPELETFANITILAKNREDLLAICDKIRRDYPVPRQENPAHGQHRGQTIKIIVEGLGKVFIRVNDLKNEALSTRGRFDEIDNFQVPDDIIIAIDQTLKTVEETSLDIRKVLSPELFGQQISIIVVLSPENKTFTLMVPPNITAKELYTRVTGKKRIPKNIETRIATSLWADRWENTTVKAPGNRFENRQYVLFKNTN